MVTLLGEVITNHSIVHSKWVNFIICKICLNKAVKKMIYQKNKLSEWSQAQPLLDQAQSGVRKGEDTRELGLPEKQICAKGACHHSNHTPVCCSEDSLAGTSVQQARNG